jgi:transcriptional regulator with XRE-family HTH domain
MVLRQLRKQAGLTSTEVAEQVGVSVSTITRVETGHRGIARDDLAALLAIYGAPRALRNSMLKMHSELDKPSLLDRGELNLHPELAKWIDFEQDATHIRNYETLLVPGLLQTFPYARAILEHGGLEDQEIENRVAARIARQALLRQPNRPRLDVVLHEAALHQRVGGVEVMREQLKYLVEMAKRPSVNIQIVPAHAGAHAGMNGSFVIMDYAELPSIVHVENMVASLYLEESADLQAYRLAYKDLLAVAHPPEHSVELIKRIAADMA